MNTLNKIISILVVLSFFSFLSVTGLAVEKQSSNNSVININTAGISQLKKLPRIGESTAKRIIEFRKQNGKFKRKQDLMKVKGIGEKTFQKLEKKITV